MNYVRPLNEAKGFRAAARQSMVDPAYCSHTSWIEYGDYVWDYTADPPDNRARVLLMVCGSCGQTPEEITTP